MLLASDTRRLVELTIVAPVERHGVEELPKNEIRICSSPGINRHFLFSRTMDVAPRPNTAIDRPFGPPAKGRFAPATDVTPVGRPAREPNVRARNAAYVYAETRWRSPIGSGFRRPSNRRILADENAGIPPSNRPSFR